MRKVTRVTRSAISWSADCCVRVVYSLQANVKTAEGGQHVDRDAQSRVLNDGAVEHMSSGIW